MEAFPSPSSSANMEPCPLHHNGAFESPISDCSSSDTLPMLDLLAAGPLARTGSNGSQENNAHHLSNATSGPPVVRRQGYRK